MKQIPLTDDKFALVDDLDFEEISKYKWYVVRGRNVFYAHRHSPTINGKQKKVLMHRQIMGVDDPNIFCDHIDGNGLNNQRLNLRVCSNSQNLSNRGHNKNNTSGYKGVTWHKKNEKWLVKIRANNRQIHIGYFSEIKEAAEAYNYAAKKLHGMFAHLNNVP